MGNSAYTKVTILGEQYRVSGDSASGSIPDLAAYVDHKISEVKQRSSIVDSRRIAVLAALNLADELMRERARTEALIGQVKARAEQLGSTLEETLTKPD